jgi:tRNA (guanine-N7-)-methyltransferase
MEARRAQLTVAHGPATTSPHRTIRSFVLRQGRFSPAQQRAYESLLPRFGIAFAAAPLNLSRVFGRTSPKILEIGFGMGETTAAIAKARPKDDFLAIEVHRPGVGGLLKLIEQERLANVRIVQHDAVEVVEHMLAPGTLAGAHVFFPDPWPKKRHHKRRLLQSAFVHALAERLAPRGYLHVATDWEEYAVEILETLRGETLLANTSPGFAPRPEYRPLTKFERRGLKLGHGVWDILFERC